MCTLKYVYLTSTTIWLHRWETQDVVISPSGSWTVNEQMDWTQQWIKCVTSFTHTHTHTHIGGLLRVSNLRSEHVSFFAQDAWLCRPFIQSVLTLQLVGKPRDAARITFQWWHVDASLGRLTLQTSHYSPIGLKSNESTICVCLSVSKTNASSLQYTLQSPFVVKERRAPAYMEYWKTFSHGMCSIMRFASHTKWNCGIEVWEVSAF
jgi:hypothetical protein